MARRPKALALAVSLYQSGASFALVIIASFFLNAEQYIKFSVALGAGQLSAIALFEWLRIASMRFYPGVGAANAEAAERAVINRLFLFSAFPLVPVAIAFAASFDITTIILIITIAPLQGFVDLRATMARFRDDYLQFVWVIATRATLQLLLVVIAACYTNSSVATLLAIMLSHLICTVLIFSFFESKWKRGEFAPSSRRYRDYALYGMPAAAGSSIYTGTVFVLKILASMSGATNAIAGVLLAIDLLQRPFVVIITSIHGVLYPSVVSSFDSWELKRFHKSISSLIAIEVVAMAATSMLVYIGLLLFARSFVGELQIDGFYSVILPLMTAFVARSLLINVSCIPIQLSKSTQFILVLAVFDLAAFWATVWLLGISGNAVASSYAFMCTSLATLALSCVINFRVYRRILLQLR